MRGLTRLANEITGTATPGTPPRMWLETATVHLVVSGYGLVTLEWRGKIVPASYLVSAVSFDFGRAMSEAQSFRPAVLGGAVSALAEGDAVLVAVQPPNPPIVLGKILLAPEFGGLDAVTYK